MRFLDRFRYKKTASPLPPKRKEPVVKPSAPEERLVAASSFSPRHELSFRLLRKPHVSEKAGHLAQLGTYAFQVPVKAEKIAVKKAVEALYKVKVTDVRTARYRGKAVSRQRVHGRRVNWKKAFVTLAKGQKIELYEGV